MTLDNTLVAACAKTALRHFSSELRWKDDIDETEMRLSLFSDMVGRCWHRALNDNDAFTVRDETPVVEKAVAECIRSGLDRSKVTCKHDFIRLKYPNFVYQVHKEISGYTARPVGASFDRNFFRLVIGFPPERFAAFLQAFDALAPAIRSAVEWLMGQMRDIMIEIKRERMVCQVREKVVAALIQEYLTPIGVSADFHVACGYVSLHLRSGDTLEGHLTIPFENVREELSDSGKILSLMKKQSSSILLPGDSF